MYVEGNEILLLIAFPLERLLVSKNLALSPIRLWDSLTDALECNEDIRAFSAVRLYSLPHKSAEVLRLHVLSKPFY